MTFTVEKDPGLIPQILSQILDSSVNGITLADPDQEGMPIVYANKQFEAMTGYSQREILGRNCRFLQGTDGRQEGKISDEAGDRPEGARRSRYPQLSKRWRTFFEPRDTDPPFRWGGKTHLLPWYPIRYKPQPGDDIQVQPSTKSRRAALHIGHRRLKVFPYSYSKQEHPARIDLQKSRGISISPFQPVPASPSQFQPAFCKRKHLGEVQLFFLLLSGLNPSVFMAGTMDCFTAL